MERILSGYIFPVESFIPDHLKSIRLGLIRLDLKNQKARSNKARSQKPKGLDFNFFLSRRKKIWPLHKISHPFKLHS